MKHYDYIILGTGPAGYKLAQLLSKTGKSLLAVEGGLFGGTCPNVGCEPKIFLSGAVHTAAASRQLTGHGISRPAKLDWDQLMSTKKARFDSWPAETKAIYEKMCDVAVGYGQFVDAHTIEVNGQQYSGDKIIIATGHRPHRLDIPGEEYAHDSTDVLSLARRPDRAVFIGGGYVAIELASFLAVAGTRVDMLIRSDRILRGFYSKYAKEMVTALEKQGITFHFHTNATAITAENAAYRVATDQYNELVTDYVVDASGRVPNVEWLNLPAAGIKFSNKGIAVDDHLQTSAPGVYAIGDITSQPLPKLTPVAELDADYLFQLFEDGHSAPIHYPTIGTAAFAFPEIAQVGVSPDEAVKQEGFHVEERNLSGGSLYAGLNEQEARLTVVYDNHDHLVGASEIGATAADDINNLVPIIGLGINRADWVRNVMPIYPALADKVSGLLK
ncbi:MAG TPA: NAD(P)/FAD-dependent oxidoreductase [Candidatus Limosilactobacillus merdipullorum]|uniref:NAD(P)/FAD-dependent oxidoreductase n=1 Tax=Candidatus Limosilactobacillus merdipullorum TaxID=2838653 RepID=A0A9D1QRN6_9LACO|nr:NAD(P)/FAD-dependent oxidoreductase [Candidatus Limosilactobacillus merdipullorum]